MNILVEYLTYTEANELSSLSDYLNEKSLLDEHVTALLNYLDVGDPYMVRVKKPISGWQATDFTDEDRIGAIKDTWRRVAIFILRTKDKFEALITEYNARKAKLIAPLTDNTSITDNIETTGTNSSTRGESDTPVSSTFEQFPTNADNLSFAEQSKANATNSEKRNGSNSRTYDTDYNVELLGKLERNFVNPLTEWYNLLYREIAVMEAEAYGR